ncbi:hypothetical protein LIA77_09241 [Sarocladium implicatum]|nr:hypothetical protein LIA77_09241 [Sarocladium implicatum]
MASRCGYSLGLAAFALLCMAGAAAGEPLNFQHFFPNFDNSLRRLLRENCTEVYGHYVNEWSPSCEAQGRQMGSCRASRVIDCLNNVMHESWKTNMSSATVLLGILPAALVLLGSNTPQVSLLALRRPILAFTLAVGTPGVTPTRALQYADHLELLEGRLDVLPVPSYSTLSATIVTALQYLVAFGAVGNVVHITWQLCILTVCSFAPETIFMPALWVATSFLVNIGSYWAAKLRTRVVWSPEASREHARRGSLARFCADEFTLSSRHVPTKIKLNRETYPFITISWITSLGAIGNLILGTLTLSGLQYIGVRDAMVVIARYFASAIACRVVLNLEIAGMRATVDITESSRFRRPSSDGGRKPTIDSAMPAWEPHQTPHAVASGANPYGKRTDNSLTERLQESD